MPQKGNFCFTALYTVFILFSATTALNCCLHHWDRHSVTATLEKNCRENQTKTVIIRPFLIT